MHRSAIVLSALLLFSLVSVPANGQAGAVRFNYTLEDPADDVMLIAANGSERWSEKPEVDVRGYRSAVDGDALVQTLTFAAAPPEDVSTDITLVYGLGASQRTSLKFTGAAAATASTRSSGATAAIEGDSIEFRVPMTQLPSATCLQTRFVVVHEPEDDPITSTDAGAQGWQDIFEMRPHRCIQSFGEEPVLPIEDGMDGPCPPASVPDAVKVNGEWDDPRGDVAKGLTMGTQIVVNPAADILRLTSALEGNEIVVRLTVAEFPNEKAVPLASVQFALEGKTEEYDFESKDTLFVGFTHPAHEAHGNIVLASDDGESATRQNFYARGERDGDTFVARFCASVIPDQAQCWAPHATVQYNDKDRSFDEIEFEWDEGPCAGKTAGGSTGANDGDDPIGDGGGGPDGAGDADAGDGEGAGDARGSGGESDTPGLGVAGLLMAGALAAVAVGRRR